MGETSLEPQQIILKLLERAKQGGLKASEFRNKLGPKSKQGLGAGLDVSDADLPIASLIQLGLIDIVDGARDGPHPRARATYRLNQRGRQHLRPARPDIPETQLKAQEAFILLQVFRANERRLTRSKLNEKLTSKAATTQLEFDIKNAPATVDFHLATLVEAGSFIEERGANTVSYHLDQEQGIRALATANQHDAVTFNLNGAALNALLATARVPEPRPPRGGTPPPEPLQAKDIKNYIEHLTSDTYAGKNLIPIHEVRRLVAERLGAENAAHSVFDPLIKRMRSEGQLRLNAIADGRGATQEQLNDSIPGMNETLFYIVIRQESTDVVR